MDKDIVENTFKITLTFQILKNMTLDNILDTTRYMDVVLNQNAANLIHATCHETDGRLIDQMEIIPGTIE